MTKTIGSKARALAIALILVCLFSMLPVSAVNEGINADKEQTVTVKVNTDPVNVNSESDDEPDREGEACIAVLPGSWQVNFPYVFFSGSIYVTFSNGGTIPIPVAEQTHGNFSTTGVYSVRFLGRVTNWHSSYGNDFDFLNLEEADVDFTIYLFSPFGSSDD